MKAAHVEEEAKGKQITLALPKSLIDETKELASRTGVSRNRIVARALDHYLALHRDASSTKGKRDAAKKK